MYFSVQKSLSYIEKILTQNCYYLLITVRSYTCVSLVSLCTHGCRTCRTHNQVISLKYTSHNIHNNKPDNIFKS